MPIEVKIVTQNNILYEGKADMVILPGIEGEMGILPHHAPLMSRLNVGVLRLKYKGEEEYFAISGGVVEVQPEQVMVLADVGERSDEIDVARAEAARARAAKAMAEGPPPDPGSAAALEMALKRAEVRLKVAQHRKPPRSGRPSIHKPK